jgi:hypothetical protein
MSDAARLVAPGSSIVLIRADSRQAVQGTIIEVGDETLRALLDDDGQPGLGRLTECGLVVVAGDGRSTVVAVRARPSSTLTELHPHGGDPPERRAHPRVPASNLVTVHVAGRMGNALEGHLLDLSLGGCRFVRRRKGGSVISKRSSVTIETMLDGAYVRVAGEVMHASTQAGEDVFSVKFTALDVVTWAVTEAFVDRRLARVAQMSAVTGPVPAKVEARGETFNTRFDPLDGSLHLDLPSSASATARFRLPGVAPTLTAVGLVTDRSEGRSIIRWNRTDPVTGALMERASASRRAHLDAIGGTEPDEPAAA